MIPTIGCTSFAGQPHGLIFPPKMRTEIINGKKVRFYVADKMHYLPSNDDRRLAVLGMNWRSRITPAVRDKFIVEAQSKGCSAFVGTMSTCYEDYTGRQDWLSHWMFEQYMGGHPTYSIQDMQAGFERNFMLSLPCLADKRGDEGIPGIVPYVLASDGSSGTEGALLKMLMTASAYTPPAVLSEIIMLKLYPAYLRAILVAGWTQGGIMDPAAHQPSYDVNELSPYNRADFMRQWCSLRTAPPEVCRIQLVDPKLPPNSVVTPSFVGGILPKDGMANWLNSDMRPLKIKGISGANGVYWDPDSTQSILAVVREGAMPAYVSFWNEGVMG